MPEIATMPKFYTHVSAAYIEHLHCGSTYCAIHQADAIHKAQRGNQTTVDPPNDLLLF